MQPVIIAVVLVMVQAKVAQIVTNKNIQRKIGTDLYLSLN